MRKGFGFFSPHETSVFLLKALLLSFWIGVDLIACLVMWTIPLSVLLQNGVALIAVAAALVSGTVFSILFAWATGSLFGRQEPHAADNAVGAALQSLKRRPYLLLGAGAVAVSILLFFAARYFTALREESELMQQLGRANLAIARKCSEVATLERQLFQSDEQFVMAQCLIQYDQAYASLRTGGTRSR